MRVSNEEFLKRVQQYEKAVAGSWVQDEHAVFVALDEGESVVVDGVSYTRLATGGLQRERVTAIVTTPTNHTLMMNLIEALESGNPFAVETARKAVVDAGITMKTKIDVPPGPPPYVRPRFDAPLTDAQRQALLAYARMYKEPRSDDATVNKAQNDEMTLLENRLGDRGTMELPFRPYLVNGLLITVATGERGGLEVDDDIETVEG